MIMHRTLVSGVYVALGLLSLANGQDNAQSPCIMESIDGGGDTEIVGIQGENADGIVCCPLECGQCGGAGCGRAGAGNRECCVNGVFNNQPHCMVEDTVAPCVIHRFNDVCDPSPCPENSRCEVYAFTSGDEPRCFCLPGYENIGNYMSSSSNRPDGGIACTLIDPCSTDPCGENSLCEVYKVDSDDSFGVTEALAACSCQEGYENTGPSYEPGDIMCTSTGEEQTCSNGVVGIENDNGNGVVCCPLECGQCGGQGCATAGSEFNLVNTDCCINGVLRSKPDCLPDTAPCVMERF